MNETSPNSDPQAKKAETRETWRIPDFLFDQIHEAIFVVNGVNMTILDCNPFTETLTGFSREEIIGNTPIMFHQDEEEYELLSKAAETSLKVQPNYAVEHGLVRKDKEEITVEHLIHLVGDPGKAFFTVHIVRDITARKADELAQRRMKVELEKQVLQRTAELRAEIDERKRIEHNLEESRMQLALLLKNLPGMAYRCRNDRVYTMEYVSEGCLALTGFPNTDLINNQKFSFNELIVPEDRESVWQVTQAAIERNEVYYLKYRIITASGVMKWLSEIGHGIPDKRGKMTTLEGFILDVTREREAEAVLRANEERYRTLVELSTEPIVVMQNEKIVYINPAGVRFFGADSADELVGTFFRNWVHPDSRESVTERVRAASERGMTNPPKEQKLLRKDGSVVIVEAASNSTFFGGEFATQAILRDITERRKTQDELYRSRELLRLVLDTIPQGVFWKDRTSVFQGCNKTMAKEFFISDPSEIKGKKDSDFFPPQTVEVIRADDRFVMENDKPKLKTERLQDLFGKTVWLRIDKVPLHDLDGKVIGVLGTYEDITARKKAEDELARYSEELKRSNADLEQFAYVASHDLQEPLRMISSYLQLLDRKYTGRLDAEADEAIGFAVDGAHRLQQLINDLLAYSRVGTRGKPFQKVNLNPVADEVVQNLRFAIEEANAEVVVHKLPAVNAERTQIVQLIQNLVGNALKFRGESKLIINIGAEQQKDGFWRCWVRDNGIGIDPKFKDRVFVIFQRLHTRGEYPGTGIGLAICKKIVERHGGMIWVESEVGQGAVFYFTLPGESLGSQAGAAGAAE